MAEHAFDIDRCGFGEKVSAPKINERILRTHQEWKGNHELCVITLEIFYVSCATTQVYPSCPQHLLQGNVGVHLTLRWKVCYP